MGWLSSRLPSKNPALFCPVEQPTISIARWDSVAGDHADLQTGDSNTRDLRIAHEILCIVAAIALLTAGLAGCQGFRLPPRPHTPANGIALQPGEPGQGAVDTGDLTLSYGFAVTLEPSRQLHLSGKVLSLRTGADSVTVYLNILDSAGHVMDTSVLYSSGFKPPTFVRRARGFDTTLPLPPGAAAIAFSSSVQASRGHR
jgi:hypothetical protein